MITHKKSYNNISYPKNIKINTPMNFEASNKKLNKSHEEIFNY